MKLLCLVFALVHSSSALHRIISGEIVGRNDTLNFPYHIQIRPQEPPSDPYCGGVLIGPKFVKFYSSFFKCWKASL